MESEFKLYIWRKRLDWDEKLGIGWSDDIFLTMVRIKKNLNSGISTANQRDKIEEIMPTQASKRLTEICQNRFHITHQSFKTLKS